MATMNDPLTPERNATTDIAGGSGRGYQIVAVFETFERARTAFDRLKEEGIPASEMEMVNRDAEPGYSSFDYDRTDEGFWGAVKRFFGGHEDSAGYTEALRRGQAMLVVRPTPAQHDRVVEILEGYDPIDFDAQQEEWRRTGWAGNVPLMATRTESMSTGAPGRAGVPGGDQTIPVAEESIRIGKREVDRGGVRVRSYVVERPFEQDVTLRDERVDVERRAVDRPAGSVPEDAFRERTIEVRATGEEAVVQKDARVIEEVVVSKDARDRTETVRDKTRKTEVEVEDTRTGQKNRPTSR